MEKTHTYKVTEKYTLSLFKFDNEPYGNKTMVENNSKETLYVLAVAMGCSGLDIDKVLPGAIWHEGVDEYIGVFESYEEADKAADEYLKKMMKSSES